MPNTGNETGYIPPAGEEPNPNLLTDIQMDDARIARGLQDQVRNAQTVADQRKQVNDGDWRVRLSLAPNADYLYKAAQPGILSPLAITNGVIFPYTPTISMNYRANYDTVGLTHTNYASYFYKNSQVDPISLSCSFTAQDTDQANYLLATIHFFRSVTKMFYGQDAQRGAPPPLVYLTGLGEFQFNGHPCVVTSFNYNLPPDVDYIRAGSVNNVGLDLTTRRVKQSVASNSIYNTINRLTAAFTTKGAIPNRPATPNLGLGSPTYVPTKMEVSLQLLPVVSRQRVSNEFSVRQFANGDLLKGGFW